MTDVKFLIGTAGSGKTYRCLEEIRSMLREEQLSPPLVFLAPKQATFQLEQQLLSDGSLQGYSRLHILSFERLAQRILEWRGGIAPVLLSEEGRIMVLRSLLSKNHQKLNVFRASSRLPGFARSLSESIRELQQHRVGAEALDDISEKVGDDERLRLKLRDIRLIYREYLDWLSSRGLEDAERLLDIAAESLSCAGGALDNAVAGAPPLLGIDSLWMDGFAEMTPQEINLLTALAPFCRRMTLAFCMGVDEREDDQTWLSAWGPTSKSLNRIYNRFSAIEGLDISIIKLHPVKYEKFHINQELRYLEQAWSPAAAGDVRPETDEAPMDGDAVRLIECASPEAEALFCAREIRSHVIEGGRYRDVAVILRGFTGYDRILSRVFAKYDIPFFMDKREQVGHHPIVQLMRHVLRLAAFNWRSEDLFAALKTGVFGIDDRVLDWLENEAIARGWNGEFWYNNTNPGDAPELEAKVSKVKKLFVPPLKWLDNELTGNRGEDKDADSQRVRLTGARIVECLKGFWEKIDIERRLHELADEAAAGVYKSAGFTAAQHETVMEQLNSWLESIETGFADDSMQLRDWLPVFESSLSTLTIGIIPPALDQVVVGTIDRSRNPEPAIVFLLGVNESVFPAAPATEGILNDSDRERLSAAALELGPDKKDHIGREHYYGYIAFTRATRRLYITFARRSSSGGVLNPSPFIYRLRKIFPGIRITAFDGRIELSDALHRREVMRYLFGALRNEEEALVSWGRFAGGIDSSILKTLGAPEEQCAPKPLPASAVNVLYDKALTVSVSGIQDFAACPFKFFLAQGLRVEERKRFEIDIRQRGSFQHEILERFHNKIISQGLRWRDLSPSDARDMIGEIADEIKGEFSHGLFSSDEKAVFSVQSIVEMIRSFIDTLIRWMPHYGFDPAFAEVVFGGDASGLPGWRIDLPGGNTLTCRGKIDRIDLQARSEDDAPAYVVMDYKSGRNEIDDTLLTNGIDIQLPAYLNAVKYISEKYGFFGYNKLEPAGMFYLNIRGNRGTKNKKDVLNAQEEIRHDAYKHKGRFKRDMLREFDLRKDQAKGDQFNYALTKDGGFNSRNKDPLSPAEFDELLDNVKETITEIGRRIFDGEVRIDPYKYNASCACDRCFFKAVCRIDPWIHRYRALT
ncbi:MAG: PD-(D/E)XK nuclease family protein [Verrucomicrobia bacterium]|nr:PD-(D/E)XK nuclease family protein [Verrucomicrobiota bacterium]